MFFPLTTYQDNAIIITKQVIRLLRIRVTDTTLRHSLKAHPDYPSLLSIMDSFSKWKVRSIGIQAGMNQLHHFPTPFIAHIKGNAGDEFTVVKDIDEKKVTCFSSEERQWTALPLDRFSDIYRGTVLLAEGAEDAGEAQYRQKRRQELLKRLRVPFVLLLAVLLTGLVAIPVASIERIQTLFRVLFSFLSLGGSVITGLLLWYEVDKENPILHKICTAGKNTNCGAVLQSKAAQLGGLISWSEVGFIYFTGSFLSLLLGGMSSSIIAILAWLNILAVPYIFFSVYYQWRIVGKWCVLCLTVQALLLAELVVNFTGKLYAMPLTGVSPQETALLLFSFLAPGLVWSVVKPLWLQSEEGKRNKTQLLRLKRDPRIFEALLPKQKMITEKEIQHLGIQLGNPEARYQLVKVCNPYCGPCARAHPKIEDLLESNPEVSARIIFTATDDEKDKRSWPVKHLMAIYEKGDSKLTKQALDDWYNAKRKDYNVFAEKYLLNGELHRQHEKLKAMRVWCERTGISFTPTFFVNGNQLPDIYSVEDLKYLLA